MVATPDLGSGAERRGGSSPFIRTAQATRIGRLFRLIKELSQRVAPRQTCLWAVVVCYANIRDYCAIVPLKINFRHIAHQSRQSPIATTSLRFALGFCRRSSPAAACSIVCHNIAQATVCWQSLFCADKGTRSIGGTSAVLSSLVISKLSESKLYTKIEAQ